MNQIGRCLWTYSSSLLRREKINKNVPLSYSVLSVPRIFASQNIPVDTEHNDAEILPGTQSTKDALFRCLRSTYECSLEEIEKMVNASPSLRNANSTAIVSNAKYLKENGLSKSNLVAHPWVLVYNTQLFPSALKLVKVFHHDVNVSLHLLVIPYKKLLLLSKGRNESAANHEKSKIEWLSELLECDEHELSKNVSKHNTILSISRDRILHVLNILKGGGVALEDIVKDISIFKHNSEVMSQRLCEAREKGITNLKPWSLRCTGSVFQRTIERRVKMREFLGNHKSVNEYLSTRLQCEEDNILYIARKIPQLKHISVLKVKELLDYLYEVGYSPTEVYLTPRILTRSMRTVKSRVVELQLLGLVHPNLLVLCKTKREYKELIGKLKSSQ